MRDFLDFIQPDKAGYVEIRSIRDGKVRQWWEEDRQAAIDLALAQSDDQWDVYYGVLPRLDRHGDARHIVPVSHVLWADLDAKLVGSKQQALMSVVRYPIGPSVVIDSGHGYHVYWRLDQPIAWESARTIMIGIAHQLKGDHVYDQARIMRIPGTTNWKHPEAPAPVRTIVFNATNILRSQDFYEQQSIGMLRDQPTHIVHAPRAYIQPSDRERLPSWLSDLIEHGVAQGQRSEAAFKVMVHLIRRGWSDAEIRTTFEFGGIGEKMREQRDGERWFIRSLTKARQGN